MNRLTIEAYSSGTTRIADPAGELITAQDIRFATNYPGGLYGDASFYVPREVVNYWALRGAQRVAVLNGMRTVYEGYVDRLESLLQTQGGQGISVPLIGAWGKICMARRWRKRWADDRISDEIWMYQTTIATYTAAEKCTVDRQSRLRFTPKAEAWGNNEFAAVRYTMPVGETVKKVTYSYDLQEGGQSWEISVWRSTDAVSWTQMTGATGETYTTGTTTVITASGTGSINVTLATPSRYLELRFYARAGQTPTSDGTYYGEFSSVVVYSETSAINLTEVAKDVRGKITDLNSSEILIASNTYSLVPLVFDRWETTADILTEAASFGDASFNSWACGLRASGTAPTPDGKPILFDEQQPALTDYDYALRWGEENIAGNFQLVQDHGQIRNWIIVEYQDENRRTQYLTPDDDADLKDTTSMADYGQRDHVLSVGQATVAMAENYGRRELARRKDPTWTVTSAIPVVGYVRAKNGQPVPSSEIVAGKRLKVENYPRVPGSTGTSPIFLISRTDYDDTSQVTSMSFGPLSELFIAPFAFPESGGGDATPDAGGGSGGEAKRYTIAQRLGYKWWEWAAMSAAERRAAKERGGKNRRR